MKFRAGMLGACIVVLALFGGILFGYVGNVDTEPTTERGYRTVADATGLFSASNERIYTDFIPAKNYTGWTYGEVDFNGTTTANSYYIVTDPGQTHEVTVDLSQYNSTNQVSNGTLQAPYIYNGYNIRLSNLLQNNGISLAGATQIKIDLLSESYTTYTKLSYGDTYNYRYIPNNWIQANPTNIGVASADLTYYAQDSYSASTGTFSYYDGTTSMTRGAPWSMYADSVIVDGSNYLASTTVTAANTPYISTGGVTALKGGVKFGTLAEPPTFTPTSIWLTVDPATEGVVCYSQTNNIVTTEFTSTLNDCTLSWVDSSQYNNIAGGTLLPWGVSHGTYREAPGMSAVYFGSTGNSGWSPTIPTHYPSTSNVKITYNTASEGTYVKIADGFDVKSPYTYITWQNGYENGSVDVVFHGADGMTGTYGVDVGDIDLARIINFSVNHDTSTIFYGSDSYGFGDWDSYVFRFLAGDGMYFIPIISWQNFQMYQTGTPVKVCDITGGDIGYISLSSNCPRFSFENTSVWMDQYGVVMNNPTITPRTLFPADSYPSLVLALDDFTVFGSSITINGTSYPVTDDMITIGDSTLPLRELSVRWEDNHTYLDTGDGYSDLGETTDNTVSMAGAWYFTADIDEGYDYESKSLTWDVGRWGLNTNQFIIVYEGLILAGIVICKRAKGIAFSFLDWVVTIIASIGGIMII